MRCPSRLHANYKGSMTVTWDVFGFTLFSCIPQFPLSLFIITPSLLSFCLLLKTVLDYIFGYDDIDGICIP